MTKKKEITLEMIFNNMQSNYSAFMNAFDQLKDEMYKRIASLDTKVNILLDKENLANNTTISKMEKVEIPDTEYITITADGVLVGGESVKEYNGQEIYNLYHLPAYFKETRDIATKDYGFELLELHCLQSSTNDEYGKTGAPVADKNGENAWCRCVYKDKDGNKKTTSWVFHFTYSSAANCANACAYACAGDVSDYSAFRSAVFGVGVN